MTTVTAMSMTTQSMNAAETVLAAMNAVSTRTTPNNQPDQAMTASSAGPGTSQNLSALAASGSSGASASGLNLGRPVVKHLNLNSPTKRGEAAQARNVPLVKRRLLGKRGNVKDKEGALNAEKNQTVDSAGGAYGGARGGDGTGPGGSGMMPAAAAMPAARSGCGSVSVLDSDDSESLDAGPDP